MLEVHYRSFHGDKVEIKKHCSSLLGVHRGYRSHAVPSDIVQTCNGYDSGQAEQLQKLVEQTDHVDVKCTRRVYQFLELFKKQPIDSTCGVSITTSVRNPPP